MDLISRQAAIDAVWDGTNMDIYTREVKEILEELPTAEPSTTLMKVKVGVDKESLKKAMEEAELTLVAEPRKGKWIDYCGGVKCDQCGFECDDTYYLGEANFCPNCGARMEESE